MNTVGEPYSGKPNVRIDEGRPGEAVPNRAAYSTCDAAVAPTFVLPGELQDEFVQLASLGWSLAAGSSPVGGPLAPDQLSVPAEQRLGAGQQRLPIRPGQEAADGSQQEAVGRLPAWPADLALEDTELVS